jgi:single-strand DNA-binding protein
MNNISISGRLTKDPECKEFSEGKSVCDITVAVNGYRKEDTIFIKIKAWDGRARSCSKFCKKGSLVNVTGSLRENSWKAKDGSMRKELYVLAADIEFVQRPQEGGSAKPESVTQSNENQEPSPIQVSEEDLEEVPF